MTAEKIAELKRLWAAETPGEWVGELHDLHDGFIDDKGYVRLETPVSEMVGYAKVQDVVFAAEIYNAFPSLIAALEAAEEERDALQEESAYVKHQLEWVEESGDTYTKSALMDFIRRTLHAINHTATIKEAIAARDARMKAEGAAEWLECHRNDDWLAVDQRERFDREAAELRRKGING